MAFSPCAIHGGGYAGGANTFFLRLVAGSDARGGKLQACANCATLLIDYLTAHASKVSEGESFFEYTEPFACMNCGGPLDGGERAFYGNAYPRGHAETQWYARCCGTCLDAVATDLHLDEARRPR